MLATYVRVTNLLDRLRTDERGVTAVEYGIMAAVIAGGLAVAFGLLEANLKALFMGITFTTS
jgi:pilus assembly protein Flp/PilA